MECLCVRLPQLLILTLYYVAIHVWAGAKALFAQFEDLDNSRPWLIPPMSLHSTILSKQDLDRRLYHNILEVQNLVVTSYQTDMEQLYSTTIGDTESHQISLAQEYIFWPFLSHFKSRLFYERIPVETIHK
ncbi:hypothetical protein GcM1_01854 [Golovinomyces cichoracearum]|uniref:Uncharacterized protein n=1 Tax=Golovinomyces cichoracearum TaxID=62708 RepID=A0A420II44_9PEZI|nr:hypothetical protein GcM1_01854 [Golovinomyces cichoracearum]